MTDEERWLKGKYREEFKALVVDDFNKNPRALTLVAEKFKVSTTSISLWIDKALEKRGGVSEVQEPEHEAYKWNLELLELGDMIAKK